MERLGQSGVILAAVAALSMVFSTFARAEPSHPEINPGDMVPLVHGPNWVDLDGDGREDLVVKSRYSAPNPSPHSFSVYSFNIFTDEDIGIGNQGIHWYVVSFPDLAPPTGQLELTTYQGMFCLVRDIRLLVWHQDGKPSTAMIVQGSRWRRMSTATMGRSRVSSAASTC